MIHYLKGDATNPQGKGKKLIIHIVNDKGGWGRGFVMALSEIWPEPEADYRDQFKNRDELDSDYTLGGVRFIPVTSDITVANMLAQHGMTTRNGVPAVRYDALEECLKKIEAFCAGGGHSVHMPRIGCGLAGGKWEKVEPIILKTLKEREVFVYDLE